MGSVATSSVLESREPYRTLLDELLADSIIDDVRVAFVYGTDSVDIAYLREDLLAEDMLPRVEELHGRAKHIEMLPGADTAEVYGDAELFVGVREDAAELYFFGTDDSGLVATAERTESVLAELLSL